MKIRMIVIVSGSALLIAAAVAVAVSPAFAAPRLIVPPEGVAFGEIPAGEAAKKAIELRNVSSFPVLISQVKGCCGADAALSTMRIEPSSGATLKVSLKPTIPGEFSKHVRILCNGVCLCNSWCARSA